jgi:two-component system response regulator FixJ
VIWNTTLNLQPQNRVNPTVFIVDDDPAVRDSVKMLIESYGWHASTFDSAEAFLAAFRPGQGGCLVLDLHMPAMNGTELLENLRRRDIHIPVIIITAYKEEQFIRRARQLGAYAVVMKPFKDDELLSQIDHAFTEAT